MMFNIILLTFSKYMDNYSIRYILYYYSFGNQNYLRDELRKAKRRFEFILSF